MASSVPWKNESIRLRGRVARTHLWNWVGWIFQVTRKVGTSNNTWENSRLLINGHRMTTFSAVTPISKSVHLWLQWRRLQRRPWRRGSRQRCSASRRDWSCRWQCPCSSLCNHRHGVAPFAKEKLEGFTTIGTEEYVLWEHRDISSLVFLDIERPHFQIKEASQQHINLEIFVVCAKCCKQNIPVPKSTGPEEISESWNSKFNDLRI